MLKRTKLNIELEKDAYTRQLELAEAASLSIMEEAAKAIVVPNCPRCGIRMVTKTNSKLGTQFFGCVNFPSCKKTINID